MDELKECIDLQVECNRSRNLFHQDLGQTMKFAQSTLDAAQRLGQVSQEGIDLLIDYTTGKVLQELCRVNQYFSFQEEDRILLKSIYRDLYQDMLKGETPADVIAEAHYKNLRDWLEKTNPFSQELYREKEPVLDTVACSEYSAVLQKDILRLNRIPLSGPILDIGCGRTGNLVYDLRKAGFDAWGIDRFADDLPGLEKADWLTFDYGIEKWATVVSNLGFSNHFVHNHLREDGNYIEYARTYTDILKSLKPGGYFCYAPDLPFIEMYLDINRFMITKYDIVNLSFKTTVVKRLN